MDFAGRRRVPPLCCHCPVCHLSPFVAKFDGGLLPSAGGILVLREIEQRLRIDRPAPWI
jgi:hypothetical protein